MSNRKHETSQTSLSNQQRKDSAWLSSFDRLEEFYRINGRGPENRDSSKDARDLYLWSIQQRVARKSGHLSDEKIEKLDALGFEWAGREKFWGRRFDHLQKFLAEKKKWPSKTGDSLETSLAGWLSEQKASYREGKLSKANTSRLVSLGMDFRTLDEIWESRFQDLRNFIQIRGRWPYPSDPKINGVSLAAWVVKHRREHKIGNLSDEKKAKLDSLGMKWNYLDETWAEFYDATLRFKGRHGRLPVKNEIYEDIRVGQWLNRQKQFYKAGHLSEEQVSQLSSLGFDLTFDRGDVFWDHLKSLQRFVQQLGRLPKADESFEDFKLGGWLIYTRHRLRNKPQSDRFKALEQIGAMKVEDSWEESFRSLKRFVDLNGRVPNAVEEFEGKKLGVWVTGERSRLKAGSLPEERARKLKSVGVEVGVHDNLWLEMYTLYAEFVNEHDRHPSLDEEYCGKKVGAWAGHQRALFHRGRLRENGERLELLVKIGFPFESQREKWTRSWENSFDVLKGFIAEHGRAPSPTEVVGSIAIGKWFAKQKSKMAKDGYPEERKRSILELGVSLERTEEKVIARLQEKIELLEAFHKEHGRLPKRDEHYRGENLGSWLKTQKGLIRHGKFPEEFVERLYALGVVLDHFEVNFERMFLATKAFYDEHSRWPQGNEIHQGLGVGDWLANQRFLFKRGQLPEDRLQRLIGVGVELDPIMAQFYRKVDVLKSFISTHLRLPVGNETHNGVAIAHWLRSNRHAYRKGQLSPVKISVLKELGVLIEEIKPAPTVAVAEETSEPKKPIRRRGLWSSSPEAVARREIAIELRKQGYSIGLIAKQVERSATEVCQVLKEAGLGGLQARVRATPSGEVTEARALRQVDPIKVLELREKQHLTYNEIADRLGVSTGIVRKALNLLGAKTARSYRKGKYWIDKEAVKQLHENGLTMLAIAKELGTTAPRIRQVLIEAGLVSAKPPMDENEVRRLYSTGMTTSEIARHLGVNRGRVANVIRTSGLGKERRRIRKEEIKRLHREGLSLSEIAGTLAVDDSYVFRVLKQEFGSEYTKSALTPEQREQVIALRTETSDLRKIAKSVGVPFGTVRAIVMKAGYRVKKRKAPDPNRVAELKTQGLTIKEIAKKVSASTAQVTSLIKKLGLTKPHREWTTEDLAEIRELTEVGISEADLAQHYQVGVATIQRVMRMARLEGLRL